MYQVFFLVCLALISIAVDYRQDKSNLTILNLVATLLGVVGFFLSASNDRLEPVLFAIDLFEVLHIISVLRPDVLPQTLAPSLKFTYFPAAFIAVQKSNGLPAGILFVIAGALQVLHHYKVYPYQKALEESDDGVPTHED